MQLTVRVILITLQLQGAAAAGAAGAAGAAAGAARASTTGELIRKTRLYTTGAEKRQTHYAIHHVESLLPGDLEKPSNQFTGLSPRSCAGRSDHNGRPQGVRSSADKSPQKGDSHLQTRDTQPKWLEASE